MTAEFVPHPNTPPPDDTQPSEAQLRAERAGQALTASFYTYLQEQKADLDTFSERTRLDFSLATCRFLRSELDVINQRRRIHRQPLSPTLPRDLVEHNLRDISLELREAPARSQEISQKALQPAFRKSPYQLQVGQAVLLGKTLQQLEHPLAGCTTDVLMAYGRSIATLAQPTYNLYY